MSDSDESKPVAEERNMQPSTPSKRKRVAIRTTGTPPATPPAKPQETPKKKTPRKKHQFVKELNEEEEEQLNKEREEKARKEREELYRDRDDSGPRRSRRLEKVTTNQKIQTAFTFVVDGKSIPLTKSDDLYISDIDDSDAAKEKATKRRKMMPKKKKQQLEEEIGSSSDSDVSLDEEEEEKKKKTKSTKVKAAKKATGTSSKPRRTKKEPSEKKKKATVIKKKKKNETVFEPTKEILEAIEKIEDEESLTSKSHEFNTSTPFTASRETIRAVMNKDYDLLEKILKDEKHVFDPFITRSSNLQFNALDLAIRNNDLKATKMLTDCMFNKNKSYAQHRASVVNSINSMDTGSHGKHTYRGRKIRRLNASRGGKEGNNALNDDNAIYNQYGDHHSFDRSVSNALRYPISPDMADLLLTIDESARSALCLSGFYRACEAGQFKIAQHLVKMAQKFDGFGVNQVHVEALTLDGPDFTKYRTVSATKKGDANGITPVHVATLNPNTKYLRELVAISGPNISDIRNKKPIHFAASAETTAALKVLLERGAAIEDVDQDGASALHEACKFGRAHNVELLLQVVQDRNAEVKKVDNDECVKEEEEEEEEGTKRRKKKVAKPVASTTYMDRKQKFGGRAPMHHAAFYGNLECIKVLLKFGADVNVLNSQKETPLVVAATQGHLDCVQLLLENGANIGKGDKLRKTCLLLAVKNGHFEIAKYLISKGASPNAKDSSNNSCCHYAAAYGWLSCLKLLVEAGADVNIFNDWKMTPLLIAMGKGHFKCADFILDRYTHVNAKDSDGRTLLLSTLANKSKNNMTYVKYLLEKKNADATVSDMHGIGAFHILAKDPRKHDLKLARLLLRFGAVVDKEDNNGLTPLLHALKHRNTPMIDFFLVNKAKISVKEFHTNAFHTILSSPSKETERIYTIIKRNILKSGDEGKELIFSLAKSRNEQGETPLLVALGCFSGQSSIGVHNYDVDGKDDEKLIMGTLQPKTPVFSKQLPFDDNGSDQEMEEHLGQLQQEEKKQEEGRQEQMNDGIEGEDLEVTREEDEQELQDVEDVELHESDDDFLEDEESDEEERRLRARSTDAPYNTANFIKFLGIYVADTQSTYDDVVVEVPNVNKKKKDSNADDMENDSEDDENDTEGNKDDSEDDDSSKEDEDSDQEDEDQEDNDSVAHKQRVETIGKNALHFVVEKRNLQLLLFLLHKKVNVNAVDYKNRSPLLYAVDQSRDTPSNFPFAKVLLKYSANVSIADSIGRTALHCVFVSLSEEQDEGSNNYGSYRYRNYNNNNNEPIEICSDLVNHEGISVNQKDKFGRTALHYAAKKGFAISSMYLIQRGANLNEKDSEGNTPLGLALLNNHIDYAVTLINKGATVNVPVVKVHHTQKPRSKTNTTHFNRRNPMKKRKHFLGQYNHEEDEEDKPPVIQSLFNLVLSNNQMGLAYLLIDLGVDPTQAVQDALETSKFDIVPTLISKTARNMITKLNANKQNLFHIIAKHDVSPVWLTKVGAMLTERSLNMSEQDAEGKTPLHYACIHGNTIMVKFLLQHKVDPNVKDNSHYTPLFYLCISNNEDLATVLLQSTKKVNVNVPDNNGKTALFYAICPKSYGTYENEGLVRLLVQNGANIDHFDNSKNSPLYYAYLQASGKFSSLLLSLGAKDPQSKMKKKAQNECEKLKSETSKVALRFEEVDVQKDADAQRALLEEAIKAKKQKKHKETGKKHELKVDKRIKLRNAEIYEKDDIPFDVLLQKTEIEHGASGFNNFYKMQLVWNKQQDIYVVFTRFGRVGETGNYQQTPFFTADEAVADFCHVFKNKTGNVWGNPKEFSPKPNKYRMVEFDRNKVKQEEILKPVNLSNAASSKLDDQVQQALSLFCDVKTMRRMLANSGLGTRFNIAGLSRETLHKAVEVLKHISEHLKKLHGENSHSMEMKERRALYEQIMELSNEFYALVPHTEFVDSPVRLIGDEDEIKAKMQILENLSDFRIAARILVASMYRMKKLNPLDYCYNALQTHMVALKSTDGYFEMIRDYIHTSSPNVQLLRVLKVSRKDEAERFAKFESLNNRMLLWHGSGSANFMSILTSGLKIAPPDAPRSGLMFGRGLYFADCFAKSLNYTRYSQSGNVACLLVCQVALGDMAQLVQGEFLEEPKQGTQSTKGVGQRGPDFAKTLVRWDGAIVPNNPIITYPVPYDQPYDQRPTLNWNEYIVYNEAQVKIEFIVQVKVK